MEQHDGQLVLICEVWLFCFSTRFDSSIISLLFVHFNHHDYKGK